MQDATEHILKGCKSKNFRTADFNVHLALRSGELHKPTSWVRKYAVKRADGEQGLNDEYKYKETSPY